MVVHRGVASLVLLTLVWSQLGAGLNLLKLDDKQGQLETPRVSEKTDMKSANLRVESLNDERTLQLIDEVDPARLQEFRDYLINRLDSFFDKFAESKPNEEFCAYPEARNDITDCINNLGINSLDCESVTHYISWILGECFMNSCNGECETFFRGYRLIYIKSKDKFRDLFAVDCPFPRHACEAIELRDDYEQAVTNSPVSEEYEPSFGAFCKDGKLRQYQRCIHGLTDYQYDDCDSAYTLMAAANYCVEKHCEVSCEQVQDLAQADIAYLESSLAAEGQTCNLGNACSQIFPDPEYGYETPYPGLYDDYDDGAEYIEPTKFPGQFPIESPTQFPLRSPTSFPTVVPSTKNTKSPSGHIPSKFPTEVAAGEYGENSGDEEDSDGLVLILGIVLIVVGVLLIVGNLIFFCCLRSRKAGSAGQRGESPEGNKSSTEVPAKSIAN